MGFQSDEEVERYVEGLSDEDKYAVMYYLYDYDENFKDLVTYMLENKYRPKLMVQHQTALNFLMNGDFDNFELHVESIRHLFKGRIVCWGLSMDLVLAYYNRGDLYDKYWDMHEKYGLKTFEQAQTFEKDCRYTEMVIRMKHHIEISTVGRPFIKSISSTERALVITGFGIGEEENVINLMNPEDITDEPLNGLPLPQKHYNVWGDSRTVRWTNGDPPSWEELERRRKVRKIQEACQIM